jgi:hypothetical protein
MQKFRSKLGAILEFAAVASIPYAALKDSTLQHLIYAVHLRTQV